MSAPDPLAFYRGKTDALDAAFAALDRLDLPIELGERK